MKTLLTLLLLTSINIVYAQTCYNNTINDTPDSRYTNNNNGTITDKTTKLIWKQCSEGQDWTNGCSGTANTMNWQAALTSAATSNFAGKSDWQLPNAKQLKSITSYRCYNPSINQTHFPRTPDNYFWSSSPDVSDSSQAWAVSFKKGNDLNINRNSNNHVRLVRPTP